jgi:signal transduction histidine kinase
MLAAAEFLEETQLDSYQKSLIATQVSCGKTLLQVIEHVLDFSKINSLAKVCMNSPYGGSLFLTFKRTSLHLVNKTMSQYSGPRCSRFLVGPMLPNYLRRL